MEAWGSSRLPPGRKFGIIQEIVAAVAANSTDIITSERKKCMIEANDRVGSFRHVQSGDEFFG